MDRQGMKCSARILVASAVMLTALGSAGRVRAATFDLITTGKNPSNTADYSTTGPRRQFRSTLETPSSGTQKVCVRYASVLAVDVAAFGNTESEGATSSFFINFQVVAPGEEWYVKITSYRKGACTIVNDGGAYADVELVGNVVATSTVGGTLTTLQFPGHHTTNDGSSGSNRNESIDAALASHVISGTGTQNVSLNFTWNSNVISHGGIGGGDEAALRLGLATTGLNRISAGNYPGLGGRSQFVDGHYVCVEICAKPKLSNVLAGYCGTIPGSNCTFTATGKVTGCPGQNYNVLIRYYRSNGTLVANTSTSVTNGATSWNSSITVPGDCTPPYFMLVNLINKPGEPGDPLAEVDPEELRVEVQPSEALGAGFCGSIPMPGFDPRSAWLGLLALIGLGASAILRRRSRTLIQDR